MNGQSDLGNLLFSAEGRMSRTPFVAIALALIATASIYESVVGPTLHWLTGWVVYPILFFCSACALSKRLHDRGKSGWFAALILVAIVAIWPEPVGFFDFIFGLVVFWATVELGLMGGEAGTNRFGAPL